MTTAADPLADFAAQSNNQAGHCWGDRGFDWGWLGLIGLIGLAGLMRRNGDTVRRDTGPIGGTTGRV
jgi:hypothetical protein